MSNPWFQQEPRPSGPVRHRRQSEQPTLGECIVAELRRDVWTVVVTGPVIVPIWWGIWKVCDDLWSLK